MYSWLFRQSNATFTVAPVVRGLLIVMSHTHCDAILPCYVLLHNQWCKTYYPCISQHLRDGGGGWGGGVSVMICLSFQKGCVVGEERVGTDLLIISKGCVVV